IPLIDSGHGLDPILDPGVGHTPVILRDEDVATVSGTTFAPLEDVELGDENYTALAIPYDDIESTDLPLVVRIGQGAISTLARGENEAITLIEGDDLLAPSYDPAGWVWSGAKENDGTLMVTRPGSEVVSVVSAPALADHEVRSIRVSRDGARLAMIQELGDEVSIQVAMVIRDEDGTPTAITEPATIGNSVQDSTDLAWVDSVTLAVLGSSD